MLPLLDVHKQRQKAKRRIKNMELINLTPHAINIYNEENELVLVIEPSGQLARITTTKTKINEVNGVPIFNTQAGNPEGLPPQEDGKGFIVSGIFRSLIRRSDLYQPGELLRDEKGQPIGCIGLSQ
jgi:hypothetical protein